LSAFDSNLSLDYLERRIAASKLPLHERNTEFNKIEEEEKCLSFLHIHFNNELVSLARFSDLNTRTLAQLRCAETALAIERYRLKYDALPESLEQLVPEFMEEVPRDPFDNEVLRYIKHDDGYTVYTIGEDGIDNGGLSKEQIIEKTGEEHPKEYDWPFTVQRQSLK
jgi:hypothetical protein